MTCLGRSRTLLGLLNSWVNVTSGLTRYASFRATKRTGLKKQRQWLRFTDGHCSLLPPSARKTVLRGAGLVREINLQPHLLSTSTSMLAIAGSGCLKANRNSGTLSTEIIHIGTLSMGITLYDKERGLCKRGNYRQGAFISPGTCYCGNAEL